MEVQHNRLFRCQLGAIDGKRKGSPVPQFQLLQRGLFCACHRGVKTWWKCLRRAGA